MGNQRDSDGGGQQLQREAGTVSLFAPAYGNLGSNIYFALGLVAAYALGLTPLAFVVAGTLFVLTVLTYTEGRRCSPKPEVHLTSLATPSTSSPASSAAGR